MPCQAENEARQRQYSKMWKLLAASHDSDTGATHVVHVGQERFQDRDNLGTPEYGDWRKQIEATGAATTPAVQKQESAIYWCRIAGEEEATAKESDVQCCCFMTSSYVRNNTCNALSTIAKKTTEKQ